MRIVLNYIQLFAIIIVIYVKEEMFSQRVLTFYFNVSNFTFTCIIYLKPRSFSTCI